MITATGSHYLSGSVKYPRVSSVLEKARGRQFIGVAPDLMQAALARGRAVHAAIEYLNRGCLDETTVHPLIRGYVASYRAWRAILNPVTIRTEHTWVSDRHRYGGRLDWKASLSGRHSGCWIIDIKSGAQSEVDALQTAAYWALDVENDKPKGPLFRAALYVHRDGSPATFVPHTDPNDLAVFLSYRNIYEWEEKTYGNESRDR